MSERFRSLKAFREFEQRKGEIAEVGPLQVLAVVKKHPQGVSRSALAAEVSAPVSAVDEALHSLIREDLVRKEAGATPGDDRFSF